MKQIKTKVPHEEWMAKIIAHSSDELSPAEAKELSEHFAACQLCSQQAMIILHTARQLRSLVEDDTPQQRPPLPQAALAFKQEIAQRVAKEGELPVPLEAENKKFITPLPVETVVIHAAEETGIP